MSEPKVVLVTGVSSGIGRSVGRLLAERGFRVLGTSRNPSDVETVPGVEVLPLDVRLDESVAACVDAVLKQAGRLDVLINNAGYWLKGALEETSLEEAQGQFETNFWGAVRMVRAALPIMRLQKSGQIINISSLAGVFAAPFSGFYCASKFALEGYTEALRYEVSPFNIRVSLVEPGVINTRFVPDSQPAADQILDYVSWRERGLVAFTQMWEKASEPTVVAQCILRIVNDRTPRLRYQTGRQAGTFFLLRRFLPASMFERIGRRSFRMDVKE